MSFTKTLIFIPTFNEAGNIKSLIETILHLPLNLEILVVDDRSPDGTGELVAKIAQKDNRVNLISRKPPRGRGLAGRDGFAWFQSHRQCQFLVEMDADFSHNPKYIPDLINALGNSDVAIGSRYVSGGGEVGRHPSRVWT
ncbi:glycosyltransferase, partial [bacterium]|nr:glycosyltransferase [bacterium]